MVHACNPKTLETKAEASEIQGCQLWHNKLEASLGDTRQCLKKTNIEVALTQCIVH